MTKTILASALALAFCSTAMATPPQWVDSPVKAEEANTLSEQETFDQANYAVTTTQDAYNIGFAKLSDKQDFDKNLWVFGEGTSGGKIIGLWATGDGVSASNRGNVYANHSSASNYWRVKGVFVDESAQFTNNGLVYAKDALGISVGSAGTNSIINRGVVVAEGTAAGVDLANGANAKFDNQGQIIAMGNGAMGIRVTDGIKNPSITNSGSIIAQDGAIAIGVFENNDTDGGSATTPTINLVKGSHIEGIVAVNQNTTINVSEVQGETLELVTLRDTTGTQDSQKATINLTKGSSVTIRTAESVPAIGTSTQPNTYLDIGTLTIDKDSAAEFKLSQVGTNDEEVLTVDELEGDGKANVSVGYTAQVSDQYQKGDVETAQLFDGVKLGQEELTSVTLDQGLMGDAVSVTKDEQGNYTTQVLRTNDLLSSAQELAMTNALMWRSQLSNLSDRMGTLRTMPETAGAWARYNNGRLDGDSIQHDYNTIEVGFDKVISSNVMLGVSFDYTRGDTDVTAGSSDNNTYTFGLYGSYFNDSGCFLDTMLKVGRIDTDYDLRTSAGAESSDYMMTGVIFGIETGHRWDIQNFFVEPQIQLTYSYLRSEDYVSNIGRHVSFDNMDSLIARVGVMGGMKFAEDRGAAYVKASYNHDFLGDVEGNYSLNGASRTFKDEMDDNWGEVSLGASYQATDSINTFIDVGTGFGGDIDQKWRVNLGARYVF